MSQESALARRMWHQLEPVHALLYFAPEVLVVDGSRARMMA
jgi:hypothetical protein